MIAKWDSSTQQSNLLSSFTLFHMSLGSSRTSAYLKPCKMRPQNTSERNLQMGHSNSRKGHIDLTTSWSKRSRLDHTGLSTTSNLSTRSLSATLVCPLQWMNSQ